MNLPVSELLRDYGFTLPERGSWAAPEQVTVPLPALPDTACEGRCLTFAGQWDVSVLQLTHLEPEQRKDSPLTVESGTIPPIVRAALGTETIPVGLRWVFTYALLSGLAEIRPEAGVTDSVHRRLHSFTVEGHLLPLLQYDAELCVAMAGALWRLHASRVAEYGSTLAEDSVALYTLTDGNEGATTVRTTESDETASEGWFSGWFGGGQHTLTYHPRHNSRDNSDSSFNLSLKCACVFQLAARHRVLQRGWGRGTKQI